MLTRRITKVELLPDMKVYTEYLESAEDGKGDTIKRDPEGPKYAHPDLIKVFEDLAIHLGTLTEYNEYTDLEEDPTKLKKFNVTKVTLSGGGEHEGVILTGTRSLKDNRMQKLESVFTKLTPAHSHYAYAGNLSNEANALFMEADAYLNGKFVAEIVDPDQLSMFDQLDESLDEAEKKHKKPRNKKSKKVKEAETEETE
jgi:hypothetical protein